MTNKNTAGRLKVAFAFLLLFGPAFLLVFFATRGCSHKFKELPDLGAMPAYSFTDLNGKQRSSKEFSDDIVLITTIQESCPNNCAISLVNLNLQIYQLVKNTEHHKIISFVTDEEGNPLEDLSVVEAMLKDRVREYDPEKWILASGDARKLYDLKKENRKLIEEEGTAFQEIMLLLDKSNHLRMIRSGKQEGMIREMKQHIALLQKQYDIEEYEKKHKK